MRIKRGILAAAIGLLFLFISISGCIQEEESKNIKLQIFVVYSSYDWTNETCEYNNESYIIDVCEGDYFGIPASSVIVSNKSVCNVSDGSQIFRLISIMDENHVKIQFNENTLYNYTTRVIGYNPARDPSWELEKIYIDNPIIITTDKTLFFPKIGSLGHIWQVVPNPYVRLYLNITSV